MPTGRTVTARRFAEITGWSQSAVVRNLRRAPSGTIDGKWIEGARFEETEEGPRWRVPFSEIERFKRSK